MKSYLRPFSSFPLKHSRRGEILKHSRRYLLVSIPDLCTFTYCVVSYKRKYVQEVLVNRLFKLA